VARYRQKVLSLGEGLAEVKVVQLEVHLGVQDLGVASLI
jgi:hypothetical protein